MFRENYLTEIKFLFNVTQSVAILGPRQCGKTTLAKEFIKQNLSKNTSHHYFDLEKASDFELLQNSYNIINNLEGVIVIDEIQIIPELFRTLRVLIDENKSRKFLILGSASRDLIRQSSETLAGRISYLELPPFNFNETNDLKKLLVRGGFPQSFLAKNDKISYVWRDNYIKTFLERDIPALGINIPSQNLRRFWVMLSHYHGNIFNASAIANSLSLSNKTIRSYLDILVGTFMIRELRPWYENIKKRQVKSSKIYFRDNGILNNLLGIRDYNNLFSYPKLGFIWEGFALEQIIQKLQVRNSDCYFWATSNNAELDLLVFKDGKRLGFEFKYSDNPKVTKAMKIALADLKLDKLYIINPNSGQFSLSDKIERYSLAEFLASS